MAETNFHNACNSFLEELAQQIENSDKNSKLDVEYSDGILKITVESSSQTYVINRHSASQKIWYSSPISGADYFSLNENGKWLDAKGEEVGIKLFSELKKFFI